MNFAVLPPELNSTRIFAGAGPGPLQSAAASWDGLAQELDAAANDFAAITSAVADGAWQGPAMLAMTRAAAPYLTWLRTAAAQAEQTAIQAQTAASIFETAQAAIVQPAIVAANRNQLMSLVAANMFGQNAPAIAAAEAGYEQMWAQDVAAMADYYAGAASAASQLAPFEDLVGQLSRAYAGTGLPALTIDWNTGAFNLGAGNTGINNIGIGNTGNGNIGFGNTGNGNIGFGNIGDRNLGIGITGNAEIGFLIHDDRNIDVLVVGDGDPHVTALVMGGTKSLLPLGGGSFRFLATASRFMTPFSAGFTAQFLETPAEFFPFTGPLSLSFDSSVAQGVTDLHTAIMAQHAAGNHVLVYGTSQSATIATLEMHYLQTLPANLRPGLDELSFTLVANPNRPDGGLLARFTGFHIPGLTFSGGTPPNVYPTLDYAVQYDGVNDFPKYPLNIFSTANALAGILFLHSGVIPLPSDLASGVVQPVSSPDLLTKYILLPTEDLPLLIPLRAIPIVGDPLADLIQPDLRVLVELGYDRTGYQDVPTPFGLFPTIDPTLVATQLGQGAVQGVNDALAGLGFSPPPPLFRF